MTYFDTDVLINAYLMQDTDKNRQANDLVEAAIRNSSAIISTLSVQETLFVLGKLQIDAGEIHTAFEDLMKLQPVAYGSVELHRAYELATNVGFENINDCIHTAIAETHCTELVTYNKQDFDKIRGLATLMITIL